MRVAVKASASAQRMRATMKACHHAVHIERKTRSLRDAIAIRIKLLCRATRKPKEAHLEHRRY
jgi:hypothetical protein